MNESDKLPENAVPVKFHLEQDPQSLNYEAVFDGFLNIQSQDRIYHVYDKGVIIEIYIVRGVGN